jgi:hypothetical protein
MEYVQFATSQSSSVNLHHVEPRWEKAEFLPHLKALHVGEQAFD